MTIRQYLISIKEKILNYTLSPKFIAELNSFVVTFGTIFLGLMVTLLTTTNFSQNWSIDTIVSAIGAFSTSVLRIFFKAFWQSVVFQYHLIPEKKVDDITYEKIN